MRFLRERTVFQPCDISPARRIRRTIDACTRVHVHVSYTCTRTHLVSKSPGPFIGESATGWASRKGVCWGWKGSVGEERCTVVFHSHYRNVLPCALVAPRNKSSVTVTMGGAQGGYRCWRGVPGGYRGAVLPSVQPSGKRGMLCNSRNLFFLPFSRSHLGPLVQESSPAFAKVSRRCLIRGKVRSPDDDDGIGIRVRVSTLRLLV